jgi:hypothetical protein
MNRFKMKCGMLKPFTCLIYSLITAILFLAATSSAHGQEGPASTAAGAATHQKAKAETKRDDDHSVKAYFKSYLIDTAYILSAPSRWDKYDWLTASLVVGTAAGLYAFDQNIHDWAQKRRGQTSDNIARFVKPFGEGQYTIPALGLVYLYGFKVDDDRAKKKQAC